jgi:hypothetical protein
VIRTQVSRRSISATEKPSAVKQLVTEFIQTTLTTAIMRTSLPLDQVLLLPVMLDRSESIRDIRDGIGLSE